MTNKKRAVAAEPAIPMQTMVQMWHPETCDPSKTQDEQSATTTYEAFVKLWSPKGWELVTEVTNEDGETIEIDPLQPETPEV